MDFTWEYQEVLSKRKLEGEIVTEIGKECNICYQSLVTDLEVYEGICEDCLSEIKK